MKSNRSGGTLAWTLAAVAMAAGCGKSTNLNQIWGGNDEAADGQLLEAKAAYDRGDFDKAESLASKLVDRNPDNEAAAVLLGYTYLSMGGIDPYRLARELIKLSESKKSTSTGTGTGTSTGSGLVTADAATTSGTSACGEGAASTLQDLSGLINLSDEDFEKLSKSKFDKAANGGAEPIVFDSDNPLIIPAEVNDELRASIPVLSYMDKAVKAVCRFVNDGTDGDGVKVDDGRGNTAACGATTVTRRNKAKSHFLWAFSHLTESLVYQSILMYSTVATAESGCKTTSNFQQAATNLKNGEYTTDAGITTFVSSVSEVNNAVSAVFDTTSEGSMLKATLNDLNAVNKAFGEIAGLPDSIKSKISDAIEKLNKTADQIGGATAGTSALKAQMTEKLTKVVGEKVDKVITDKYGETTYETVDEIPGISDDKKTELKSNISSMCGAYTKISYGLPDDKKQTPAVCAGAPDTTGQ